MKAVGVAPYGSLFLCFRYMLAKQMILDPITLKSLGPFLDIGESAVLQYNYIDICDNRNFPLRNPFLTK